MDYILKIYIILIELSILYEWDLYKTVGCVCSKKMQIKKTFKKQFLEEIGN